MSLSKIEIFAKYATPELIKARIEEMKADLKMLETTFRDMGRDTQPHPRYQFKTVHADPERCSGIPNAIIIIGDCINNDEMEAHINLYGSSAGWDRTVHSVCYFRMNGLLLRMHGGHIILKPAPDDRFFDHPIPCTDEQWEQLYSGTVPTEMLQDYYTK